MKPTKGIDKKSTSQPAKTAGHYAFSILVIGISVLICIPLSSNQGYHVVSYLLLSVVSLLATFMGIGPVFVASALSALVWNYFFIPPNYTFHIDKAEDILMFGLFFIIAMLNGIFTTRVRRQEQLALERENRTHTLFQLTRNLSKASGTNEVLNVANAEIETHFGITPYFILQNGMNKLIITPEKKDSTFLTEKQHSIAEWSFTHLQKAGAFTQNFTADENTYIPLPGAKITPGVLVYKAKEQFSGNKKTFWDTCITLIANALEREFLEEQAQKARFLDESDRLYKTLFNSISHELRIPVATIMGASDTLLNSNNSADTQAALCSEIFTASIRLNRVIENLLNMSRLESGRISARPNWHEINDLFNKVTEDLQNELKPFNVITSISENMPLVKIDFGLMEQILYNLIFNATQYAPVTSDITLSAEHVNNFLVLKVSDNGPGFPEDALPCVFNKFYRGTINKTGGLGLGLSIVKGFVEAQKGIITVKNRETGGAVFTLTVPSEKPDIEHFEINEP